MGKSYYKTELIPNLAKNYDFTSTQPHWKISGTPSSTLRKL